MAMQQPRADIAGALTLHVHAGPARKHLRRKLDGYRPSHMVRPGMLADGAHRYPDRGLIEPGTTCAVEVTFYSPEWIRHSLWPGKRLRVQEGGTVVGEIVVHEVWNPELDARSAATMLSFDTAALRWSQWEGAAGAYGVPYDPRPLVLHIARMPLDAVDAWESLWENLYHQGRIGLASLLTVPLLAAVRKHTGLPDWNVQVLAATIEASRLRARIQELPGLHFSHYTNALTELAACALEDLALDDLPQLVRGALATVAFARGLSSYGALLIDLTDDEAREVLRSPASS